MSEAFKKLSLSDKFDQIAQNIEAGKQQSIAFMKKIHDDNDIKIEQVNSNKIYNRAESIAKSKSIPLVDAMEEAKTELTAHYNKR
jgi:DNA replication protein DnaD